MALSACNAENFRIGHKDSLTERCAAAGNVQPFGTLEIHVSNRAQKKRRGEPRRYPVATAAIMSGHRIDSARKPGKLTIHRVAMDNALSDRAMHDRLRRFQSVGRRRLIASLNRLFDFFHIRAVSASPHAIDQCGPRGLPDTFFSLPTIGHWRMAP